MRTYVTCEPLIKFDLPEMVELVSMCSPVQVNIGRNSRQDITLPEPTRNEVQALITELQKFTKVVVKSMPSAGLENVLTDWKDKGDAA